MHNASVIFPGNQQNSGAIYRSMMTAASPTDEPLQLYGTSGSNNRVLDCVTVV
jgi:hypothetical protein